MRDLSWLYEIRFESYYSDKMKYNQCLGRDMIL